VNRYFVVVLQIGTDCNIEPTADITTEIISFQPCLILLMVMILSFYELLKAVWLDYVAKICSYVDSVHSMQKQSYSGCVSVSAQTGFFTVLIEN